MNKKWKPEPELPINPNEENLSETLATWVQEIGQRIQHIRLSLQMSREVLAERAGYDPSYIALIERGKRNPSLKVLVQLAEALHVSPVSLIQGSETLAHPASSVSPVAEEARLLFSRRSEVEQKKLLQALRGIETLLDHE